MTCSNNTGETFGQFGLDSLHKNWFSEHGTIDGDYAVSLEVEKIVYHEKSKYQDILVFDSKNFGRILALDNAIQVTEKDEFAYHEAMVHIPLNSHPNPKKVLIVGSGDGGVVREVAKHSCVESIVLCEIDEAVIKTSKKYLPFVAKGFDSPKLEVVLADGVEYLRGKKNKFDVIITDSPGPVGPAAKLFEKPYFQLMKEALTPRGVIVTQGETYWFCRDKLLEYLNKARSVFPVVDYAAAYLASAPGGIAGYLLAGISEDTNLRKPVRIFSPKTMKEMRLRYYTPDVHRAAFALPPCIKKEVHISEELYLY